MAADVFLKIDDIKGESQDKAHAKEIEVLSWNWGMTQSATTHSGTGGGAGKVNVHDISFTKYCDAATPNLIKSCCTGKHFKLATLTVRKAGGNPIEYLKLTMEEGLVAAFSTGGTGGADRVTETVTLNFAKFKMEYKPQKPDGSADAAIEATFDIAKNTA